MHRPFDPAPAAALLAQAWHSGLLMKELPEDARPATLAQGYDVQDELLEQLGEPVVGWKLGVGSHLQKRQSGIGRSIAGRILKSRVFKPGDVVSLPSLAPVTVEFEVAYVLGRDVMPDEPDFPLFDAVSEVRTTVELVLSRFVDRRAVGWPSFAADDAAFHALIVGDAIDPARIEELRSTLVIHRDGEEAARSAHGDDVTDPAAAFADLVALGKERKMVLPKGSVVSTGSVSKPFTSAAITADISAKFLGQELAFRTLVVPFAN